MGDLVPTNDSEYTENRRTFSPGPAVLKLTQPDGRIVVTISDKITQPTAFVRTKAKTGKAAEAVRNVEYDQIGQVLAIKIPTSGSGGGSLYMSNGSMTVIGGRFGGQVIINGVDVTSQIQGQQAANEVETIITLPKGSWVDLDIESAEATVRGEVENLRINGSSGSVSAETVGDLMVDMSSGSVRVGKVTTELDASLSSGYLKVSEYSGSRGKVRLSSGSALITASPRSSGPFDIRVSSGSATLWGSGNLNVTKKVSSGSVRLH